MVGCSYSENVCKDGTVRLSPDGPNRNEGHVEICYKSIWGGVYDRDWSNLDAAVVCSQLNFDRSGDYNLPKKTFV